MSLCVSKNQNFHLNDQFAEALNIIWQFIQELYTYLITVVSLTWENPAFKNKSSKDL